jgi:hypothetical protein
LCAHLVIGIAIVLLILAVVVWAGRTKTSRDNGDNISAANRYGPGYRG